LQATEIITHRAHYQNKKQNTEKYFFEWFHTCIEKNERIKVQIFCETSQYFFYEFYLDIHLNNAEIVLFLLNIFKKMSYKLSE